MLEYRVSAKRIDSHRSVASTKDAEIILDTDIKGRSVAFNPAQLFLAAIAACMIKGIERVMYGLLVDAVAFGKCPQARLTILYCSTDRLCRRGARTHHQNAGLNTLMRFGNDHKHAPVADRDLDPVFKPTDPKLTRAVSQISSRRALTAIRSKELNGRLVKISIRRRTIA